jgi:hypothetical protein
MEFLWVYLQPQEEGKTITILDVQGIGMRDVGGEVLEFIKKASSFTGGHYPEKCAQIYIINVPKWFNFVWNVIKGFIDPVTRNKTHIIRGKGEVTAALLEHIPMENLPPEYGGQSVPLGESEEEELLRSLVDHLNNQ